LIAFALLALVLVFAACGDDDDDGGAQDTGDATGAPSGEARDATDREVEYLEALALVIADGNEGIAALDEARAAAFDPAKSAEEMQAAVAALSLSAIETYEARRDGILNVKPQPSPELQSLHLTLSGAADDELTIAENIAAALDADPVADEAAYEALLIEQGFPQGVTRFFDACMLNQSEADRIGAEVDLHCVGVEPTS
jgi:hypothetical protein